MSRYLSSSAGRAPLLGAVLALLLCSTPSCLAGVLGGGAPSDEKRLLLNQQPAGIPRKKEAAWGPRRFLQQWDFGSQLQNYVNSAIQGSGYYTQPQQQQAVQPSQLAAQPTTVAPQPTATAPQPTATAPQPSSAAPAAVPSGQHSPKLSGEDPLALHNGYRSRHQNTGSLSYSTQLEAEARNWANKLAAECSFYHSGPGENMASGFQSWSEVMWAFYKEYQSYNYAAPGYSSATGHFTQMIWRETLSVGCAVAASSCWMGNVHVCHYSTVGNVNAPQYFRENVYPPI